MRKKSYSKHFAFLLSTLSMIGTVHAETGMVEVDGSKEDSKIIVQRLAKQGLIVQLGQSNWYEINHSRLDEMPADGTSRESREETVRILQNLVGPDVNIEETDILNLQLSSQDVAGSGG